MRWSNSAADLQVFPPRVDCHCILTPMNQHVRTRHMYTIGPFFWISRLRIGDLIMNQERSRLWDARCDVSAGCKVG